MLLASDAGTAALVAALTGGVVAAVVTSVIGPLIADRQARHEMYRQWQRELGTNLLKKALEVETKLGDSASAAGDVAELEVLAQEVALVFENKVEAPDWANAMVKAARQGLPGLTAFEAARQHFVACASDDIRGRNLWSRWRRRRQRLHGSTAT